MSGYDQRPDIVADEMGSIHVVLSEYKESTSTLVYRRRTPDGFWLPAQRLAQLAHGIHQAEVLTGSTGRLYIGYAGWQDLYLISRGMSSGGSSVLAQKVTIPAGMNSPVLSFQSWAEGFNSQNQGRFNLEVSDAFSTTTLSTITSSSNGWIHRWSDMSAWQGRAVTVTLRLNQTANQPCAALLLDEVTLGSAYPDLWISGGNTTAVLPGAAIQYTIVYGNRGSGKSAGSLSATLPSQVSLVSASPPANINGKTLSWDLGEMAAHSASMQIVIDGTVNANVAMMTNLKLAAEVESTLPEQEKANNKIELPTLVGYQLRLPIIRHE